MNAVDAECVWAVHVTAHVITRRGQNGEIVGVFVEEPVANEGDGHDSLHHGERWLHDNVQGACARAAAAADLL